MDQTGCFRNSTVLVILLIYLTDNSVVKETQVPDKN